MLCLCILHLWLAQHFEPAKRSGKWLHGPAVAVIDRIRPAAAAMWQAHSSSPICLTCSRCACVVARAKKMYFNQLTKLINGPQTNENKPSQFASVVNDRARSGTVGNTHTICLLAQVTKTRMDPCKGGCWMQTWSVCCRATRTGHTRALALSINDDRAQT